MLAVIGVPVTDAEQLGVRSRLLNMPERLHKRLTYNRARRWLTLRFARRHEYARVWTALARTEEFAKVGVQGTSDETVLAESAVYDLSHRLDPMLHITEEDDVLEIGCGVGRLGRVIAPRCRHWTGCDVSVRMLDYARRRLSDVTNVSFVQVSGFDLAPVPSASQDVVYCTVVFMHLNEWDRFSYVEEAHRVLRCGGRLYVDNVALTTDYGWNFFLTSRNAARTTRPPQIGSTSTSEELQVYLQRAGFANINTRIVDDSWVVGFGVKPS